MRRILAAALVVMVLPSCSTRQAAPASARERRYTPGGTLRVAVAGQDVPYTLFANPKPAEGSLDPQREFDTVSWAVFRPILRTLVGHNGKSTREGGSEIKPDLAARLPDVAADGLTWTFHLKPGLRYGPPLQTLPISSPDIVRALRRTARIGTSDNGGYANFLFNIQGFKEFGEKKAETISGLETPDERTLVVHIKTPSSDLANLFGLPATSPIPPSPGGGAYGIATGHDGGFGPWLVASGPYMIEGSEKMDFAAPPAAQVRASGFVPGKTLTLVRNPSWNLTSDSLRPSYPNRIELTIGGDTEALGKALDEGTADIVLDSNRPPQAPPAQIKRYQADPSLGRVVFEKRDSIRYIGMNIAQPPFDDIHIRKALNLIVNKRALVDLSGGPTVGDVSTHIAMDSLESNLLSSYDPYRTPNAAGSLELAKQEIAKSRYDANHDGICDAAACKTAPAAFPDFGGALFVSLAARVRSDASKIGINLIVKSMDGLKFFEEISKGTSHFGLAMFSAWAKDYLNASTFFRPLFHSGSIGDSNWTYTGASDGQLASWGYRARHLPNADARIEECTRTVGSAQAECWAGVDQYLMEEVVPWIPYIAENHIQVVPARIVHFAFDQLTTLPSLDQIAFRR